MTTLDYDRPNLGRADAKHVNNLVLGYPRILSDVTHKHAKIKARTLFHVHNTIHENEKRQYKGSHRLGYSNLDV